MRRFALAAAASLALGCGGLRFAAYPPDFSWVPEQQVDSAMRALARDVSELDAILRAHPIPDVPQRARVLALLGRMEASAASIEAPGTGTNHPVLDHGLARFRANLVDARSAAEAEPPSYFRAGRVSGSCLACHGAP